MGVFDKPERTCCIIFVLIFLIIIACIVFMSNFRRYKINFCN